MGLGITNQRETVLLWDRRTSAPVGPPSCGRIDGPPSAVRSYARAGSKACCAPTPASWPIRISPRPSWSGCCGILRARARAARGELAGGTVESWIVARLTGGRVHVTDHTNASRTLLYDLASRQWDPELLRIFGVPRELLGDIVPSSGVVGESDPAHLGAALPIAGLAGDQQSALFGQGCCADGLAKNTYGTGAFLLVFAGQRADARGGGARHGRLRTRGRTGLCPGGQCLHRRCGGTMASGRTRCHSATRRRAKVPRAAFPTPVACISCPRL